MILRLFPQRPDHPLADGKEFKRILAELRVDKSTKAVEELAVWFESLLHARNFRLDHYFDLLRQLDDAGQQHLRNLARDYLDPSQPSVLEQQRLWERSFHYWKAAAAGYCHCVELARLDPKARGADAFKASLALADTRLQGARRSCVKWLAYRYESAGRDLWKGLGRSYLNSETAGHARKLVQTYPGQTGLSSVAQQYLHALVFFTSSVDGLEPQQIELSDRLIAHFLPSFVCSPDCQPDSVYWVDAASGLPPGRLASHRGAARSSLRFFSPGPALPALEELIHVVERDEVPGSLNLGGEFSQKSLLPVLRHLRSYWSRQPPQRRYQRHAVKTRMAVVHGFEESHRVFAGASARPEIALENWLVENVSRGGFRACLDGSAADRIKIGSLLCMQPEGGDNWLLGTVRRVNRVPGGQAHLGVELLSRQAQSIGMRPRRSGFSAATAIPGIWLRDCGEAGAMRVVLPLGSFSVRETLDFSRDGQAYLLTPVELETTGVGYEIARFQSQSGA